MDATVSLEAIFTRPLIYRKVNIVFLVRSIWDLQSEVKVNSQKHSLGANMFSSVSEEGDICKRV